MGSRILSRSFQVSKWEGETQNDNDEEEDVDAPDANKSVDSAAMDVDETPEDGDAGGGEDSEAADDDDESGDDPADVALVPMADMLNARYGSENVSFPVNEAAYSIYSPHFHLFQAKLFYEEQDLKMITTRPIKTGEQVVGFSAICLFIDSVLTRVSGTRMVIPQILTCSDGTGTLMNYRSNRRCRALEIWQTTSRFRPTSS